MHKRLCDIIDEYFLRIIVTQEVGVRAQANKSSCLQKSCYNKYPVKYNKVVAGVNFHLIGPSARNNACPKCANTMKIML